MEEVRIDVKDPRLRIPPEIQERLQGRSEVKRYLAGDPVNTWIASLPDYQADLEDPPVHPFMDAIGEAGLCHSSGVQTTIVGGAIQGVINTPMASFFAFDEEGRIVGISVTSVRDGYPDELYREVTCAGVRRKGIGKQLDSAVIAYARELGKARIRLEPADEESRQIHTAMGFRVVDPGDALRSTYMVKDVPPAGGRRTRRRGKRTFRRKNKQWTRRR